MIALPQSRPARTYDEALERARVFAELDDASILPAARTALLTHGRATPLAVVLLHGFTNNPAQYAKFAPLLHERGVNVFVPRMPEHGDRDRLTTRIASLTAQELVESAGEALDLACGLGDRVGVLGISMGATLAAYFAQYRPLAVAVPVAPDFALLQLPYAVSRAFAQIFLWLPNFFTWWDPRERERQRPLTAYPRLSTRALMETLRVGDDVYAASQHRRQLAERIVTVVNRCDPAVNNDAAQHVSSAWSGWRPAEVEYVELRHLPENHDIIDPENPSARTGLVYPRLLAALGVATAIGSAGCASAPSALPPGRAAATVATRAAAAGKIDHVIIVVQENRSFDNLFQGYPGADTVSRGRDSSGKSIRLHPVSLTRKYDIDHSAAAMFAACDTTGRIPGTKCRMDGFDREQSPGGPHRPQYAYVPRAESKPYFDMA
ncbi:MAG TPA: alpha/beta fold hydrolase, partial [Candidatus Tumulicola sp.]